MAKKAIIDFFCNGQAFEKGKVYDDAVVAGLDPKKFEHIENDSSTSKPIAGTFSDTGSEAPDTSLSPSAGGEGEIPRPELE